MIYSDLSIRYEFIKNSLKSNLSKLCIHHYAIWKLLNTCFAFVIDRFYVVHYV